MKCGVTKKISFKSYDLAIKKICDILEKDLSGPDEWRTYKCEYCGFWHLSAKSKNKINEKS